MIKFVLSNFPKWKLGLIEWFNKLFLFVGMFVTFACLVFTFFVVLSAII